MPALDYTDAIASGSLSRISNASRLLIDTGTQANINEAMIGDFMQIELAESQTADSLRIDQHGSAYSDNFVVQCSSDGMAWTDLGAAIGQGADHTFSFTSAHAKFWRIKVDAILGNWHVYYLELRDSGIAAVETPDTLNELIDTTGATVDASTEWNGTADRAINGNWGNYWGINNGDVGDWWTIQFTGSVTIGFWRWQQHEFANANDFDIEYSSNGTDWEIAHSVIGADQIGEATFVPQTAQYWRWIITADAGANVFNYQFEFAADANYVGGAWRKNPILAKGCDGQLLITGGG